MLTTSDALIAVADSILGKISQLGSVEITKKGRKYKFINNTFQRIQKEDKHLIIDPDEPDKGFAVLLAYRILESVSPDIFSGHKDLCLVIIGVARELERNGWCEEENSIIYEQQKFFFSQENVDNALDFAKAVTDDHLRTGYMILCCAKLNFFHTDHHIGAKLEGSHMRNYVAKSFGSDALELPEVLAALKSFVHWGNIKGLLYKLDVPNMDVDEDLIRRYAPFPDPPQELKDYIYARPPSGTSKYFLARKALNTILESFYSRLIPYPSEEDTFEPEKIYSLCQNIQEDPVRYHLRSDVKRLIANPVNIAELSQQYDKTVKAILLVVGLIINTIPDGAHYEILLSNSKIPKFSDQLIGAHQTYYDKLHAVQTKVADYEAKGWDTEDIVSRSIKTNEPSFFDQLSALRTQYPEDSRAEF
ncbi:hypothetical protein METBISCDRAFT_17054 [Metschnikowia bicuspidata]|uniref:Uncharacterized protein n=1 Tax=Metschnikowia bicuspidata TaxID=27322 RepID=A0A4P9ZD92_9ASCO|nr:hypothetical protein METBISCDRAFT_17054 [Metschnikowia bicuspidata]